MIKIKSVKTSNEVTNQNEQGLMLNGTITTRDDKMEDVNFSIEDFITYNFIKKYGSTKR